METIDFGELEKFMLSRTKEFTEKDIDIKVFCNDRELSNADMAIISSLSPEMQEKVVRALKVYVKDCARPNVVLTKISKIRNMRNYYEKGVLCL